MLALFGHEYLTILQVIFTIKFNSWKSTLFLGIFRIDNRRFNFCTALQLFPEKRVKACVRGTTRDNAKINLALKALHLWINAPSEVPPLGFFFAEPPLHKEESIIDTPCSRCGGHHHSSIAGLWPRLQNQKRTLTKVPLHRTASHETAPLEGMFKNCVPWQVASLKQKTVWQPEIIPCFYS